MEILGKDRMIEAWIDERMGRGQDRRMERW